MVSTLHHPVADLIRYKHINLVGTLEKLEESLRLMEHTLPTFFSGVLGILKEPRKLSLFVDIALSVRVFRDPRNSQLDQDNRQASVESTFATGAGDGFAAI